MMFIRILHLPKSFWEPSTMSEVPKSSNSEQLHRSFWLLGSLPSHRAGVCSCHTGAFHRGFGDDHGRWSLHGDIVCLLRILKPIPKPFVTIQQGSHSCAFSLPILAWKTQLQLSSKLLKMSNPGPTWSWIGLVFDVVIDETSPQVRL